MAKMRLIQCPACGKETVEGAFCGECGATLDGAPLVEACAEASVGPEVTAEVVGVEEALAPISPDEAVLEAPPPDDVPADEAPPEEAVPPAEADDEGTLPLRVSLCANGVLQQNFLGVLELRFENAGDGELRDIELGLEFPSDSGIENVQQRCQLRVGRRLSHQLKPGEHGHIELNIFPKTPGEVLACFELKATTASGGRLSLKSRSKTLIEVNPTGVHSIQNVITVTGENAADFSGWTVDAASHKVKMVARRHKHDWENVPLALVGGETVTGKRTVRVVGDAKDIGPIERAMLVVGEGERSRRILILAKDEVRLGKMKPSPKDPKANDIVLRVMPQIGRNREQSASINRKNLLVQVRKKSVRAKKLSEANPTMLNAEEMAAKRWYDIDDGDVVSPAKVLDLQFRIFRGSDGVRLSDAIDDGCVEDEAEVRPLHEGEDTVCAVRIERMRNLAGLEEYLILRRCATIGCSETCAIVLDRKDVAMEHARLHSHKGFLFIEPLCEDPPLCVDGVLLRVGQLVPLALGMSLTIGEEEFFLTEAQQLLR